MSKDAVIVSQSGDITEGLREVVSSIGHAVSETVTAELTEDNRYYLSRSLLDDIPGALGSPSDSGSGDGSGRPYLVVDGTLHPGQVIDLTERLPPVTLRDRRGAVLEGLSEHNPTASVRFELRRSRIGLQREKQTQRTGEIEGPTGKKGRLKEYERKCQNLRQEIDRRGKKVRERTSGSHGDADGYALLLGWFGSETTPLWSRLTESTQEGTSVPTEPARAVTRQVRVGPHSVALTDIPDIPPDGVPGWFSEAVPSVPATLSRADIALSTCGGAKKQGLNEIAEDFGCEYIDITTPLSGDNSRDAVADRALEAISDSFVSVRCRFRLPHGDATQSLVSELHDEGVIEDTTYGKDTVLCVTVSEESFGEVKRRVTDIGGKIISTERSGD